MRTTIAVLSSSGLFDDDGRRTLGNPCRRRPNASSPPEKSCAGLGHDAARGYPVGKNRDPADVALDRRVKDIRKGC